MSEVDRGTARYLKEARNGGYETWNERTKFANNPAGWAAVREQFGWGSIARMSNDDKVLFACYAMGQRTGVDGQRLNRRDCHPAIPAAPDGGRGGRGARGDGGTDSSAVEPNLTPPCEAKIRELCTEPDATACHTCIFANRAALQDSGCPSGAENGAARTASFCETMNSAPPPPAPPRASSSEAPGAASAPADDDGSLGPVLAAVAVVALLAAAVVAKQKQLGPCAPKKEKASDESIYS